MKFLDRVNTYISDAVSAARYIGQGLGVTFSHMGRRPVTVQYPYEKLIPSERFRGRIHFEFDKCISCEICVRVCPINLPVVDYTFNADLKKKELYNYSIDFGICIFCANCVEFCPTNCLSVTEDYELATYDRHELNYGQVAMGRLPYKVNEDPMVTPLREFAYLPKGVMDPREEMPKGAQRPGKRPEQILEELRAAKAAKQQEKETAGSEA